MIEFGRPMSCLSRIFINLNGLYPIILYTIPNKSVHNTMTFFKGDNFKEERTDLEENIGNQLTQSNITEKMLEAKST